MQQLQLLNDFMTMSRPRAPVSLEIAWSSNVMSLGYMNFTPGTIREIDVVVVEDYKRTDGNNSVNG